MSDVLQSPQESMIELQPCFFCFDTMKILRQWKWHDIAISRAALGDKSPLPADEAICSCHVCKKYPRLVKIIHKKDIQ